MISAKQVKRKSLERASEELRFLLDKSETLLKQRASSRKVGPLAPDEQKAEERPFLIVSNGVLRNAPEIANSIILERVASLRKKIKAAHTSEHNDSLLQSSLRISSNLNMAVFDPDGKASTLKHVKRKQRHGYPRPPRTSFLPQRVSNKSEGWALPRHWRGSKP